MKLGLNMSLAHFKPMGGFDADTIQFINLLSSQGTELTNQQKTVINQFVERTKSANFWPYMRCWPMRSGQNLNSGNGMYSLGGMSQVSGSLIGTFARNPNGVYFSGGYMTAQIPDFTGNYAYGSVCNMFTSGTGGSVLMAINGTLNADASQINDAPSKNIAGGHRTVAGSSYVSIPYSKTYEIGYPVFCVQGWNGSVAWGMADGETFSVSAATFGGGKAPLALNARGDNLLVGRPKEISFAFQFSSDMDTGNYETFRELYKETLGSDLPLS